MLILYIQLLWQRVAILGILFKCRLQNTQYKLKINFRNVWVILFFLHSRLDHLPYERPDTPLMIGSAFGSHLRKPIFSTFFTKAQHFATFPYSYQPVFSISPLYCPSPCISCTCSFKMGLIRKSSHIDFYRCLPLFFIKKSFVIILPEFNFWEYFVLCGPESFIMISGSE